MKITVEIDDKEIETEVKRIVTEEIAKSILKNRSTDGYIYRRMIKDAIRETIKADIDNLSDRAVKAASVSIANKGLKKVSTEELLNRLSDMHQID